MELITCNYKKQNVNFYLEKQFVFFLSIFGNRLLDFHFKRPKKPTTKCFNCLVIVNCLNYFYFLTASVNCKHLLICQNRADFKVALNKLILFG